MSALDMSGTIDNDFRSVPAQRTIVTGGYVSGKWVADASSVPDDFTVTLQPITDGRTLQALASGGERITDARRVYINDGDLQSLKTTDLWDFEGVDGVFRVIKLDNRPWRNYCKLIVSRKDA